ncbi:hypothetical protein R3I94_001885 [Phoxinus phoxinus]
MSWKPKKLKRKGKKRELKSPMFPGGRETSMGTSYHNVFGRIDLLNLPALGSSQRLRRCKLLTFRKRSRVLINIFRG